MTDALYWNWQHIWEAAIVGTLVIVALICFLAILFDARKSRSFRERRRRLAALGRVSRPSGASSTPTTTRSIDENAS